MKNIAISIATVAFLGSVAAPAALAGYQGSNVSNTIRTEWGKTKAVSNIKINNVETGSIQGATVSKASKDEWVRNNHKNGYVKGDIHTSNTDVAVYEQKYRNTAKGNIREVSEYKFDQFSVEAGSN